MSHLVTEVYEAFRAAGVDESASKAAASAIPLAHDIATRADIERVRSEIGEFKADIYRAQWIQAAAILGVLTGLLALFD